VPTNIVEGCGRRTGRDYARFIDIAVGSAMEVRYLLALATELDVLNHSESDECRDCSDHLVRGLKNLQSAIGQFEP
jgi:four helix bundle protein